MAYVGNVKVKSQNAKVTEQSDGNNYFALFALRFTLFYVRFSHNL